ncbi:hypothetical protein [Blastococcus sp. TF02A-30]|uniref:hypothetical protein n=1 Tax=Blastococcus sp. TF02A-30 TaxID=2250580 RepID=UPI000DEAE285|nr:hypothetical protein [Blastococcus sp. TF02A-30]RBY90987.1 hypothetical protein DQ241_04695 [Blastococcus sp. TF02A-30]
MEFDEVADELYAVPPDDFIALRTTRQDEAKDDGDRALAKAIGGLPKPSTAAWVCNLLVRARRAEIEGLVELGGLLREAQENLAGDELRALNKQRAQLLNALGRQAAALAREQGHRVSTAIAGQVEDTLRAAMADPEAGEALLSGRLTGALSYSGLGTVGRRPDLRVVRPEEPARPAPARSAKARGDAEQRRREREEERRRAAEEQRRTELAQARAALEDAEETAGEARAAAEEERRAAEAADDRRVRTRARVAELSEQLAQAEREDAEADAELKRAERRSRTAEREAADAEAALETARARLAELEEG